MTNYEKLIFFSTSFLLQFLLQQCKNAKLQKRFLSRDEVQNSIIDIEI